MPHRSRPVQGRAPLRHRGGSSKIAAMNYTPYMPSFTQIREPGLPAFEPGTERYKVSGGGAVVVPIFRDDRITVIDREGRQRCEIAAFGADGRADLGALGLAVGTESAGIARLLAGETEDARTIAAALRRRGLSGRIDKIA
jgi:aminomethyltransferase